MERRKKGSTGLVTHHSAQKVRFIYLTRCIPEKFGIWRVCSGAGGEPTTPPSARDYFESATEHNRFIGVSTCHFDLLALALPWYPGGSRKPQPRLLSRNNNGFLFN